MNKYSIFGIDYSATDYNKASDLVIKNARDKNSYGVSALAVHGMITAYKDEKFKELVNKLDLVVPDGQPIKWALNRFYSLKLKDRVYGPFLTQHVLKKANKHSLSLYLYGSTKETLEKLEDFIGGLTKPRVILFMIPSGKPMDMMIEAISPLLEPGVGVKEGDYILAVNQKPFSEKRPFHATLVTSEQSEQV